MPVFESCRASWLLNGNRIRLIIRLVEPSMIGLAGALEQRQKPLVICVDLRRLHIDLVD